MTEIMERVARLEDRAELQDLAVRYCLASDGDDIPGLEDCFTSDAAFSISGGLCAQGRGAIMDFLVGERSKMGLTLHTPHYGLFTFASVNDAKGLVGAHLELVLGGKSVFGAVRYQDSYQRLNGSWKIRTRDMRVIHIAPWAEVGEAFASSFPVHWPDQPPAPSDFPRA